MFMSQSDSVVATAQHQAAAVGHSSDPHLEQLSHLIEHAAHLLPAQGPISVFVHHNTLHAFEDLSFEDALRQGSKTLGCEPYLSESYYRECLVKGRIRQNELAAVLAEDLGDSADVMLGFLGPRFKLRMAMLEHPLQLASCAELRWAVSESDALRRFRSFVPGPTKLRVVAETRHWVMRDLRNGSPPSTADDDTATARRHVRELFDLFGRSTVEHWSDDVWESFCLHLLWRICRDATHRVASANVPRDLPIRHAELLETVTGEPCDELVNDLLIRFCAAFLDQGLANWQLPHRDQGFFRSFSNLYQQDRGMPDRWLRDLKTELKRIETAGISPLESIAESLRLLGVTDEEQEDFILATLQSLPGWAGMIWQMETNAEWTLLPAPQGTLHEYLAIRLLLERLAVNDVAREAIQWHGDLCDLRSELRTDLSRTEPLKDEQHAFLAFQLAQIFGWMPQELSRQPDQQWHMLMAEIEHFNEFERRRILHRAYERHYRNSTLDAIALHAHTRQPWAHESAPDRDQAPVWRKELSENSTSENSSTRSKATPSFQIICCIDDREESFRRHLEEIDPACETFGAAGFFGVAMYYRSASDAYPRPLCPVIIKPQHYVNEVVPFDLTKEHKRRADTRRVIGAASHQFHQRSRTFFGGMLTALTGNLASIPLVARILLPRMTAQLRSVVGGLVRPPAITQLTLERTAQTPGPEEGHTGYSLDEMANIVERLLQDIGLTAHIAPIVVMCGHGSSSLNNPHESAYNCGACSGGRGGPNARAFSEMANDQRVRDILKSRGLTIPNETVFIGAYHNTCDDSVTFFDLDRLPASHRDTFVHVSDTIDEARRRNAHERCRRFESAPFSLSTQASLRHVEARSEDLSQARPEYNHATDALVLVGQRWWSRNLFLDRRAFLQSYDPEKDPNYDILTRVLSAVIPVCAGIGLEYYFSCVDTNVLGCGSKLPHNITSLLGVMEGAASDLRPGLSQQMVEIHEPMRILFVIETTPEGMFAVMERNPVVKRLCCNDWVQLAVIDTQANTLQILQDGKFKLYRPRSQKLPAVKSSADWYRGWRDHLACAMIDEPRSSS